MPPRFVRTIATRSGIAHGAPIEFARCDVFPSSRLTFSPHGRSRVTALRSLPTRADSAIPKCRCSHARCTCLRYPSMSRGPCFNPQPIRRSAATGDDDAQRQLGRVSILSRSGDRLQRCSRWAVSRGASSFNPQPIRRSAASSSQDQRCVYLLFGEWKTITECVRDPALLEIHSELRPSR